MISVKIYKTIKTTYQKMVNDKIFDDRSIFVFCIMQSIEHNMLKHIILIIINNIIQLQLYYIKY